MESAKDVKTFNGTRIVRNLEKAGMDRQLAEAVVDALHESMDYVLSRTVSREEFAKFQSEIKADLQQQLSHQQNVILGGVTAIMTVFLGFFGWMLSLVL